MLFDSPLRLSALLAGLVFILSAALKLRKHSRNRYDVFFISFSGIILVLIGLAPDTIDVLASPFNLRQFPGGRLILLLLFASATFWFMLLRVRNKLAISNSYVSTLYYMFALSDFKSRNPKADLEDSIVIVIPAYNEADNIPPVLGRIPEDINGIKVKTLVIDDGSTDDTALVVEQSGGYVVTSPVNRGGGEALKTGFFIASQFKAKVIVTMDADGQHQPEEITPLVEPILADTADIVIGSRIIGTCDRYSNLRLLGVKVFTSFINVLMNTKLTDCASGFRAFSPAALGLVTLRQAQYHTAELIIDACKRELRIVERPIHIAERLSGTSKKGANMTYALHFLKAILQTWLR